MASEMLYFFQTADGARGTGNGEEESMDNPEHLRPNDPDQSVVLLAEDEVMIQNVARVVLESAGYFVLTAENGEQALHISGRYPGSIHLLLSDVRMPVMNGLELKEKICLQRPDIKIVLMSGETPPVDVPFLRKPFNPTQLRNKVESVLQTLSSPCAGG
jgi:CheY-like chemotaxis protein